MDCVPDLVPVLKGGSEDPCDKKVPITLLTGFLGAGKSTLLQNILAGDHGLRIAVLMNEFAESNEIEKLIANQRAGMQAADEWIEFDNGCLCCSVKDAAMVALESLLAAKPEIDHVLVETSGMANPAPILQKLWADAALECRAQLDGVACMVDALHGLARLMPGHQNYAIEASIQVAMADLIVINKVELVNEEEIGRLKDVIRSVNPIATIMTTSFSKVPLQIVLELGEYRRASSTNTRSPDEILKSLELQTCPSNEQPPGHGRLKSFWIDLRTAKMPLERFERWLFTLLWDRSLPNNQHSLSEKTDIMRVKGLLASLDSLGQPRLHALQAVQDMYELTLIDDPSVQHRTCLLFMGKFEDADELAIRSSFASLTG